MGFIQSVKRMFFFLFVFFWFCFGSFGWVFTFRLLRKRKEKVPKCPGKGPPEARICGSSGDPRKRKKGCVKSTWDRQTAGTELNAVFRFVLFCCSFCFVFGGPGGGFGGPGGGLLGSSKSSG